MDKKNPQIASTSQVNSLETMCGNRRKMNLTEWQQLLSPEHSGNNMRLIPVGSKTSRFKNMFEVLERRDTFTSWIHSAGKPSLVLARTKELPCFNGLLQRMWPIKRPITLLFYEDWTNVWKSWPILYEKSKWKMFTFCQCIETVTNLTEPRPWCLVKNWVF